MIAEVLECYLLPHTRNRTLQVTKISLTYKGHGHITGLNSRCRLTFRIVETSANIFHSDNKVRN